MKTKIFGVLCLLFAGIVLTAVLQAASKTQKGGSETFSALAYLPAGAGPRMVAPGASVNVTIYINRYSTDAEAKQLAQALLSGGQDAVVKALEKMKTIGKVTTTGRVGFFDLKFIRTRPLDEGGRRIIAACDRPIQFLEAYNSGRSMDYKIGIVELILKDKGEHDGKKKEEGEGMLIYAAKVKVIEGNKIEIENYGVEPAKLMGVRKL
ncbi:MAG: hypothetical protein L0220_05135 [Acidobacteria bacterium]|nr:hypothetical protein [Acidobacteriota bacterium]